MQKVIEKGNVLAYSLDYSNAKSNTNNVLVPRLRTTSLLHANTNPEEGLLCYRELLTQLKNTHKEKAP